MKKTFKAIVRFIRNFIKWYPILKSDEDFDYRYILEILKFKIDKTANYIDRHNRYIDYEIDVNKMKLCSRLIEKVQTQYYLYMYLDYVKLEVTVDKNKEIHVSTYLSEEKQREFFTKYKNACRRFKGDTPIETIHIVSTEKHRQARRILFTLLEKEMERWWD